ncbi:MAG: choice-of-anchor D domain-containing protein [Puniceicoccaceae bacterium]|nr:MAG: choice-of-anchor D domain-containing protein [Puniceicoccaceae bacterium]
MQRFLEGHFRRLGVEQGQFDPVANPFIGGMNHASAERHLRSLDKVAKDAAAIGLAVDPLSDPLWAEALTQLARRLHQTSVETLDRAELRNDIKAYTGGLKALLFIVEARAAGRIPDSVHTAHIPAGIALTPFFTRFDTLLEAAFATAPVEGGLASQAEQLASLLSILRLISFDPGSASAPEYLPSDLALSTSAFQRAYDFLEAHLADLLPQLDAIQSPQTLLDLLQAGILHERLREHFNFTTAGESWTNVRLPQVAARLATASLARDDVSSAEMGVQLLIEAAEHYKEENLPLFRRHHLDLIPPLLTAARQSCLNRWQAEQDLRSANPALQLADLVLPGGLLIDNLAGSARWNRHTSEFAGSFRGSLRLPNHAAALTINQARILPDGGIRLNAHGAIGFPADQPTATLSIPARRPLDVFWAPGEIPRLLGAARLETTSGFTLEVQVELDDPWYGFAASVQSLRFDLAGKLTVFIPELPDTGAFDRAASRILTDYFDALGGTLDGLSPLLDPPVLGNPGQPPDFITPVLEDPLRPLELWANSILADAERDINRSYNDTLASAAQVFQWISDSLSSLGDELEDLENAARRGLALRRARQALNALSENPDLGDAAQLDLETVHQALADAEEAALRQYENPANARDLERARRAIRQAAAIAADRELAGDESAGAFYPETAAFFTQVVQENYLRLGLDPNTGAIADPALLADLSPEQLIREIRSLQALAADFGLLDEDAPTPGPGEASPAEAASAILNAATSVLIAQLRERILLEIGESPESDWERRTELLGFLSDIIAFADLSDEIDYPSRTLPDGPTEPIDPMEDFDGIFVPEMTAALRRREADEARFQNDPVAGFLHQVRTAFRRAGREVPAEIRESLRRDAAIHRERLEELIAGEWPADRIRDGVSLLRTLANLASFYEEDADEARLIELAQVTLPDLTTAFTAVAEAQQAWWLLQRYQEELFLALGEKITSDTSLLVAALDQSLADTLRAAERLGRALALLLPEFKPVDLTLPGNVTVERAFGRFRFNRDSGEFSGGFGGRLRFPDLDDAVFEISQASLTSTGEFTLAANSSGPLPFGENIRVNTSLDLAYAPATGLNATGAGSLRLGPNPDDETYDVLLGWVSETQTLTFTATAQNLDLRFSDDFVFFGAGFGFEVSGANSSGSLFVSGSAGLFVKEPPLGESAEAADFQLSIDQAQVRLDFDPEGFSAALAQGTLRLPDFMEESICADLPGAEESGPAISLDPANPVQVRFDYAGGAGGGPSVAFSGSLTFHNLGFNVPGLDDFAVEVCQATLVFPLSQLPRLENLDAVISLPLPGDEPALFGIIDASWGLDGYPIGTIQVLEEFDLFNRGGFRFTVLDATSPLCEAPTAFTIAPIADGLPFAGQPEFTLTGGIRFSLPAEVLLEDSPEGSEIFTVLCSGLRIGPAGPPELLETAFTLAAEGVDWKLGGDNGLVLTNAALTAQNLQNLFSLSPDTPFTLALSGGLRIDDLGGFSLNNARFTFDGSSLLPAFSLQGISFTGDPTLNPIPGLPLTITQVGLEFNNPLLPIVPAETGDPWLFRPDNLRVTLSAGINLLDIITGSVENLVLSVNPEGTLETSLDGFSFGIQGLEIPPMELGGQVHIGNLDQFNPQDPATISQVFFAGLVKGKLNGAGIEALLAFRLDGLIGICLDVSAGPAGIPLGPTGFLLTGAQGGVSFANRMNDPCEFTSIIQLDADGRPVDVTLPDDPDGPDGSGGAMTAGTAASGPQPLPLLMTWEELEEVQTRAAIEREIEAYFREYNLAELRDPADSPSELRLLEPLSAGLAGGGAPEAGTAEGDPEIPCPTGDCPPATVNIFCTPHPDPDLFPDRVIIKFTSLDQDFVDEILGVIGLTPNALQSMTAAAIAEEFADAVYDFMQAFVPEVDEFILGLPNGEDLFAFLVDQRETQLLQLRDGLFGLVFSAANTALGDNASVYEALLDVAYAGVPCPDFTIKLAGTFSHASVSSFLSGTGGVILSTTGSAGVVGTINLIGLPVGQLRGFISATDQEGDPNPSACGVATLAFGPVELGRMQGGYSCDGCITGMLENFAGLVGCLGDSVLTAILERVAPDELEAALADGGSALDATLALDNEQRIAFIADLFARPGILPPAAFNNCVVPFMASFADLLNPELLLCGEVSPKLFGFSMGDGLVSVAAGADRNSFNFTFSYSPTNLSIVLLSSVVTGGVGQAFAAMLPAFDQATFGVSMAMPDPLDLVAAGFSGELSSPGALFNYAEDGFEHMLANTTFTMGYTISPFGFELFDSQARLLLPNLVQHPAHPNSAFVYPESLDIPHLPSRSELLLAARTAGLLDFADWKGDEDDLHFAFPGDDPESEAARQALAGKSLAVDFFPHGGILSASSLRLPRVIYDAPPTYTAELFAPGTELLDRLSLAGDFITDYLLATSEAGALAFYLPAPNPPYFDVDGEPLTPRLLLDAILEGGGGIGMADPLAIEAVFLEGYLEGQLLGIPLGRAQIAAGTEPVGDGAEPFLRFSAEIPPGSWWSQLIPEASLLFEMRQPPPTPINELVGTLHANLLTVLDQHDPQNPNTAAIEDLLDHLYEGIVAGLPKLALEAEVAFTVPDFLEPVLQADAGATVFGFSPLFEPDFEPHNDSPYAVARRRGGVGLAGSFTFGFPAGGIAVEVEHASVAVLGAESATEPPRFVASLEVPLVQLPAPTGTWDMVDAHLFLDTQPEEGADILRLGGRVTPPSLPPLFEVVSEAPDGRIGGEVLVTEAGGVRIAFDPVTAVMPLLGGLSASVYGFEEGDRFTFTTVPGEDWSKAFSIGGTIELRDPLELLAGTTDGPVLLEIEPAGGGTFFEASLEGTGLESYTLRIALGGGAQVRAFPGEVHEAVWQTPSDAVTCLVVSSDGRIYFDSGSRSLSLAGGLATIDGRIEFGYEPPAPQPVLDHTTPDAFSTAVGSTVTQTLTVTNAEAGADLLIVDAAVADTTHFSAFPSRLILPGGASGEITVRHTPQSGGTHQTALLLTSNATVSNQAIPLQGVGSVAPVIQVSAAAIDFGLTPLGVSKGAGIVLSNVGTGNLVVSGFQTSGPGFSIAQGGALIPPGGQRVITVDFRPGIPDSVTGELAFNTNDPSQPSVSIPLTGRGEDRFWIRQQGGGGLDALAAIALTDLGAGFAAGDRGALFRSVGFALWQDAHLPDPRDLRAAAAPGSQEAYLAGREGLVLRTTNGGGQWNALTHSAVSNSNYNWHGATVRSTTGEVVLVGEAGGHARFAVVNGTAVTDAMTLSGIPPLHGVSFGTATTGLAVGDNRTVLRTTDGGKTWQPLSLQGLVPADRTLRAVAARPFAGGTTYIVVGDHGTILRTLDAGTNWTLVDAGTTTHLHGVARASSNRYIAVGEGGLVLNGGSTGAAWTSEFVDTSGDFRAVAAVNEGTPNVGNEVWAVTAEGEIFRRLHEAVSGPVAVVESDATTHADAAPGQHFVTEITVGNEGAEPLEIDVTSSNSAFTIVPDRLSPIPPGGQLHIQVVYEGAPQFGVYDTVVEISTSDPEQPVFSVPVVVDVRREEHTPLGFLQAPARLDLGSVGVGVTADAGFNLANLGPVPLAIHGYELRHTSPEIEYEVDLRDDSILPGEVSSGGLSLRGSAPGTYSGMLEIAGDAANGVVLIEWILEVVETPEVVVIGTHPPGLHLFIDNNASGTSSLYTATTAFVVVDGPVEAGTPFLPGGATITAQPRSLTQHQPQAQQTLHFQNWTPGGGPELSFTAGESAPQFTAVYTYGNPAQPAPDTPPDLPPLDCEVVVPHPAPVGPWLRISEAVLELPWLNDAGGSAAFAVEGDLFLSLQRAYGSLRAAPLSLAVPDEPAYGAWAGHELLGITALDWAFDLDAVGRTFYLAAATPGIRILDHTVQPPSALEISVDLGDDPAERHAYLNFATTDELPLIPGLAALGPGSFTFDTRLDPANPFLRIALDGSLRALRRPANPSQWVVNRPYAFELIPIQGGITPLTFDQRTLLFNLAGVRVYAGAGAEFSLGFDGEGFGLSLENLEMEFFGNNQFLTTSTQVYSDGTYAFEALLPPPPGGLLTGAARLVAHTGTEAGRRIEVEGNPLQGDLRFDFPRIWINSPQGFWADNTIGTPDRFAFDSGNFTLRLPLGLTSFAGFTTASGAAATADNYFEFRRTPDDTRLRVRSKRDIILGAFKLGLTLDTAGEFSGFFSGRLGLAAPFPLNTVSSKVSLAFDAAESPAFTLNRYFLGVPARLQFGPPTAPFGRACLLTFESGQPIEDWEPFSCFP